MTRRSLRAVTCAVAVGATALSCGGDGPTGPALVIVDGTLKPGVIGQPYADTLTATGGGATKSWRLMSGALPPGVALSTNGVVAGTPGATGNFTATLRVSSGGRRREQVFSLAVVTPLVIATGALPAAGQNQAYATVLAATGGTGSYAWAVSAGTLPAGLTLTAGGVLAGTPTGYGSDTVSIGVTSGAQVVTQAFVITVVPSLAITTAVLREGTVGAAYADTLRAIGAGALPAWGIAAGALPPGLTLLSSGTISGTPSGAGTYGFVAQVTSGSQTATRGLEVSVVSALVMGTATLPNGTVGNAYAQTLTATGGVGGYAWSVASGTLPAGVTLSAAGDLAGVPTGAATFDFTLRVTSGAQQVDRAFTVVISPPDPTSVEISPSADTVELADSIPLTAVARDAGGVVLPGRPIAWSSLNAAVATVSGSGRVRGVTLGTVGIVATASGVGGAPVSDTALVTVIPLPVASVEVSPGEASLLLGETQPFTAVTRDRLGGVLTGRAVTWSSSDPNVASVDANTGVVISGAAGEAAIRATSEGVQGSATVRVSRGMILTAVGGGSQHSCGLTEANLAFCWGRNDVGQLGDSSTVGRLQPVRVRGTTSFTHLSVGGSHACALTSTGVAHCWGSNSAGRLGDGTTTNRTTPVPVSGGISFASISAGGTHTCGLTPLGVAYCWGLNLNGQLGDNTINSKPVPTLVAGGHTFASIAAGVNHTCGVTTLGVGLCWGNNTFGQLGDGTSGTSRIVPTAVDGALTFSRISGASEHSCGLATGGAAWCWGNNGTNPTLAGRLGDGTTTASRLSPVAVTGGLTFTDVKVVGVFSCGRTAAGEVLCWGANDSGQLGDGSFTSRTAPTPLAGGVTWDAFAVGSFHGCAIRDAGRTFCWGQNTLGQVGDGTVQNRNAPVPVRP